MYYCSLFTFIVHFHCSFSLFIFTFTLKAISLLAISKNKSNQNQNQNQSLTWIPFTLSLLLDIYSSWPELTNTNTNTNTSTNTESEERSRRLLDLLYYPLRSPLYESITSGVLDGLEGRMANLKVLAPLLDTLKIYRKMWENVYFYTSAS